MPKPVADVDSVARRVHTESCVFMDGLKIRSADTADYWRLWNRFEAVSAALRTVGSVSKH